MGKTPLKQFTVWYQITAFKAKLYLCPCIMSSGVLSTTNFYLAVLGTTFGWSIEEIKTVFPLRLFWLYLYRYLTCFFNRETFFTHKLFLHIDFKLSLAFPFLKLQYFELLLQQISKYPGCFGNPPFIHILLYAFMIQNLLLFLPHFPPSPFLSQYSSPENHPLSLFHLRRGRILWFKL